MSCWKPLQVHIQETDVGDSEVRLTHGAFCEEIYNLLNMKNKITNSKVIKHFKEMKSDAVVLILNCYENDTEGITLGNMRVKLYICMQLKCINCK